jgi:hypothetical protein
VASGAGPSCAIDAGVLKCLSNYSVVWSESSDEALVVFLWSEDKPSPGVAPGAGVTGISLTYSVFLSAGVGYACLQRLGCDFAAIGVTFDNVARTLSFNNTLVSPPGQPAVVFNGTLRY